MYTHNDTGKLKIGVSFPFPLTWSVRAFFDSSIPWLQLFVAYLYVKQDKTESVDLNTDSTLLVDISDALSERDKVKFTVHTKVDCLVDIAILSSAVISLPSLLMFGNEKFHI